MMVHFYGWHILRLIILVQKFALCISVSSVGRYYQSLFKQLPGENGYSDYEEQKPGIVATLS